MTNKKCNNCQEFFPLTFFHKRSDSKDGYNHQCKQCANTRRRSHYYKTKAHKNPNELQIMISKQIENYIHSIKQQLPTTQQREHLKKALNIIMLEIDKL